MHISTVVLGTANDDKWLNNQADNQQQTYQQNTNSGGIWFAHIVPNDGTPGNRLDGSGFLRCFDLVNIHTGATITRYRDNSNVFDTGVQVDAGIKGLDADGSIYVSYGGRVFKCNPTLTTPAPYFDPTHSNTSSGLAFDSNGDMWGYNTTSNKPVRMTAINYVAHTCTETDATVASGTFGVWGRNAGGIAGRIYYLKNNTIRYIDITNLAAGATDVITDAVSNFFFVIGDDQNIYYTRTISAGASVVVKTDKDGSVLGTRSITDAAQQIAEVYENGNLWVAGTTSTAKFTKIDTVTMTVSLTLTNPIDWFLVTGIVAPGEPVLYGSGATFQWGALGVIAPDPGARRTMVATAMQRRPQNKTAPPSTFLGKPFGGFVGPPGPTVSEIPRALLALRINEKWWVASQGDDLTIIAGGFQGGTPALFGTDGQNIWKLFSREEIQINTRIQTALWPLQKPTHMKEGQRAGVEITTLSHPTPVTLTLDSDFGSIPATFQASNAIVWLNAFFSVVPWVNNVGAVIPWGLSGFLIYQGSADFKGRYLGYTMTSTSPGFAVNGFLTGYIMSTPWATKAQ